MVICYDILKLLLVFYEEHNGKSSVFLCISQINLVFLWVTCKNVWLP